MNLFLKTGISDACGQVLNKDNNKLWHSKVQQESHRPSIVFVKTLRHSIEYVFPLKGKNVNKRFKTRYRTLWVETEESHFQYLRESPSQSTAERGIV